MWQKSASQVCDPAGHLLIGLGPSPHQFRPRNLSGYSSNLDLESRVPTDCCTDSPQNWNPTRETLCCSSRGTGAFGGRGIPVLSPPAHGARKSSGTVTAYPLCTHCNTRAAQDLGNHNPPCGNPPYHASIPRYNSYSTAQRTGSVLPSAELYYTMRKKMKKN